MNQLHSRWLPELNNLRKGKNISCSSAVLTNIELKFDHMIIAHPLLFSELSIAFYKTYLFNLLLLWNAFLNIHIF